MSKESISEGSYKNIWHGLGRKRIEIPKSVLKSKVINNEVLKSLYICSLGYYPNAKGHYTYRKKGLPENFLFIVPMDMDGTRSGKKNSRWDPMNFLYCH